MSRGLKKDCPNRDFLFKYWSLKCIPARAMTAAAIIVENEDSDAEYEAEQKIIEEMFPNCPFDVSVNSDELNDDLGQNQIEIVLNCICYCWDDVGSRKLSVSVKPRDNNVSVKVKDAIHALASVYGPGWQCNHRFLEGFEMVSDGVFEAFMGS